MMICYKYPSLCHTSLFDVVPTPDGSALSYRKKNELLSKLSTGGSLRRWLFDHQGWVVQSWVKIT